MENENTKNIEEVVIEQKNIEEDNKLAIDYNLLDVLKALIEEDNL